MKKQLLLGAILMGSFMTANAQNSCGEAVEIVSGTTVTVGELDGEYDLSICFEEGDADAAEWYVFTAPANGVLRINTNLPANAGGDTRVVAFSGSCDALTCWWSADDVAFLGNNNPNNIFLTDTQMPVLADQTYYVTFDNEWAADSFDAEFTFMDAACTSSELDEDWTNAASYYFCWSSIDVNDDENGWSLLDTYSFDDNVLPDNVVAIFSGEGGNDDYLISNQLNLIADEDYTFNITFAGLNTDVDADESFEVVIFQLNDQNQFELVGEGPIGAEEGITMDGATLAEARSNATTGEYAFTPEADGEYFLGIHSSSAAGTGALAIFEVTLDGEMGTSKAVASQLSVFPNPASNVINVANTGNVLVNAIQITDLNGRTVKSVKFNGVAEAQVNVSDLANGMYMMTVTSDKGSMTQKIVKN